MRRRRKGAQITTRPSSNVTDIGKPKEENIATPTNVIKVIKMKVNSHPQSLIIQVA